MTNYIYLIIFILSIIAEHCNLGVVSASEEPTLRIWIDEYVFSQGETNLLHHLITANNNPPGRRYSPSNTLEANLSLAGTTKVKYFQPKGHKMLHKHDFLWTARQPCYEAFNQPTLSYTNAISCLPGTQSITDKSSVIQTLQQAYSNSITASIMPLSFLLPSQYYDFAEYLYTHSPTAWVLKENVHRGSGLVPVAGNKNTILRRAAEKKRVDAPEKQHQQRGDGLYTAKSVTRERFVLAQRFITEQLLIEGRSCTVRLWAVLAGGDPVVRAYLFKGGIVPFGGHVVSSASVHQNTGGSGCGGGDTSSATGDKHATVEEHLQSMIVNIFQQDRAKAKDPWSIDEFQKYIKSSNHSCTKSSIDAATTDNTKSNSVGSGIQADMQQQAHEDCWQRMWSAMEASTAAVLAAAVPDVRSAVYHHTSAYQGGGVEVLGLDFVVDSKLRPWLVEVNYLPSMARKVIDCVVLNASDSSNDRDGRDDSIAGTLSAASPTVTREIGHGDDGAENGKHIPNGSICIENNMDSQKESFLRAHFQVAAARRGTIEQHALDADRVVLNNKNISCNGGVTITADTLRQVMDFYKERKTAVQEGFSDLTPHVYRAMSCIASPKHHHQDASSPCAAILKSLPIKTENEEDDDDSGSVNGSKSQKTCSLDTIQQGSCCVIQGDQCCIDRFSREKRSLVSSIAYDVVTTLQSALKKIRLVAMHGPLLSSLQSDKKKEAPYVVLTPVDRAFAEILLIADDGVDSDSSAVEASAVYSRLCHALSPI